MSFSWLKCYEYDFQCDKCDDWEVLHTGDQVDGIYVHDINSAFKAVKYHKCKHKNKDVILCDKCFKSRVTDPLMDIINQAK